MPQSTGSADFTETRPITSAPPTYHLFGFGLYLYGDRDFDEASGSFVRTLCFCLFYIPVLALRSYRVAPSYEGWSYLARVPLTRRSRVTSTIAAIMIPCAIAALVGYAYWNSPANVAMRAVAEAERLTAEGRIGDAAGLLAGVANGPTDRARPAAERLARLVEEAASNADIKSRGALFRAAVEVQKAGRWPRSPHELRNRGVSLARASASSDPVGALVILDSIADLAPPAEAQAEAALRHELLEKVVAADPSNLELASKLAGEYEIRGEFDRAEKLLAPLRDRLGDGVGARILGLCDARANRVDQAVPLLRAYTKPRLARLAVAEEKLQALYKAAQERIIRELEGRRRVYDFDYEGYRSADPNGQQRILQEYMSRKIKGEAEIASFQQTLVAESEVIPVTLELGVLLLQQAQATGDPSARKALLDEAEATFLGVSRMAGDRVDYQLSLAQVYYWQGKHDQGRKLFDQVLDDNKRDPALLLQVAHLLRDLGSHTEARPLAEEGHNQAPAGPVKEACAVLRALLGEDVEDRINWLRRSNTNDPSIKAMLNSTLAEQAMTRGDSGQAINLLKEAVALYESLPESAGTLNNGSIALVKLASLTGDQATYDRAGSMIEKAVALDPGNGLTMANASRSLLEAGLREIIGPAIDLNLLRINADQDLLGFLAKDEAERQQFAARLRSQPTVNRALSLMDKVIVLAPKNPHSYQAPARVLGIRTDAERLRAILKRLESTELDLGDQFNEERKNYSGANHDKMRQAADSLRSRFESILPAARSKGGATFAVAAWYLLSSRMAVANQGGEVDRDAMVALAEQAFASSPSLSSRWNLIEVLLHRGSDRLARSQPGFATLRDRFTHVVAPGELVTSILTSGGPLKEPTLKEPDVIRAIDLVRETIAASPSYASGPRSWALVQARYPEVAASMASRYFASESDRLEDEITAKLRPFDPSQVLEAYRIALMKGQIEEASKILADARSRGIPIPIESP